MAVSRSDPGAPGRLFPPLTWDSGWSLSLQADAAGHACTPRARLDSLEAYEAVEALIRGPFPEPVDPSTLGLPGNLLVKFTPLTSDSGPSLGCNLTRDDVAILRDAIDRASLLPNAGIPRGIIGWPGREVWHGTDMASAQDILANGIDMSRSHKGYFGRGFHVADDPALARSNYAAFSGDEAGGAVLRGTIDTGARILDLRNAVDAAVWADSGLAGRVSEDGLDRLARRAGIDGLYDRSIGGLVIYSPRALTGLVLEPADPGADDPAP